jgi:Na+/H+ antiporter NhaD/arsenite permease-like protein
LLTWVTKPEALKVDRSEPLLGDNPLLMLVFSIFGVYGLVRSIQLHAKYIKRSLAEKKPEYVQAALIIGAALAMSVSLLGVFLAFALEYEYSFIWMIAGFVATCLHFPRQRDLENASMRAL